MAHRGLLVAELAAWWVTLVALWLVLIGPVDAVEWAVGVPSGLAGALLARGARRAVGRR